MLSLDADWLGAGPSQIGNARGFAEARRDTSAPDNFQRLYVVEPAWTATGANADHRLALRPELIRNVAIAIAAHLRNETPDCRAAGGGREIRALRRRRSPLAPRPRAGAGRAGAAAGGARALPLRSTTRSRRPSTSSSRSIRGCRTATRCVRWRPMSRPAMSKPCSCSAAIPPTTRPESSRSARRSPPCRSAFISVCTRTKPRRCAAGICRSRTRWKAGRTARAVDGTASIVQPLIRPLYDTRTACTTSSP